MRRHVVIGLLMLALAAVALSADEPKEIVRRYTGHTEAVYAVAVSTDGKQLLTGSFDRTVKLFDFATGKELKTFGGDKGHQNLVLTVAFAPDGQTFASGGSDNTVKIWDVPLARPLREVALADAGSGAAISVDGKSAAVGGRDGSIKVLSPVDGKELYTLKGHVGAVTAVAYAPNNNQSLASVGIDGTLRVWNLADGKPVAVIVAHAKPVLTLAFATSGSQVYTAGEDGAIKFWQLPPAAPRPLTGHTDTVRALAITGDGNSVVTASLDKNVRVFNVDNGQLGRTLPAPHPVTAVASMGAGGNAVTFAGTAMGEILAWGADGKLVYQGTAHAGEVTGLAINGNGTQLASVGADGNLVAWALPLLPTRTIAQPAEVKSALISADGKRVIATNADNQMRIWATTNGQAEKAFPLNATAISSTADGSAIVFAGADNTITFQKRDGGTLSKLANQTGVVSLAMQPFGSQVLVAHADGSLKLWATPFADKNPKPVWEAKLAGVRKVIFEPKGEKFFAIAADKSLHIGDAKTGKELPAIAHDAMLVDMALNSDGSRLATATQDKVVRIRTLADGKEVAKVTLPVAPTRIALSVKGDKLAAAHAQDGKTAVSIFDVATGRKLVTTEERFTAITSLAFDPATRALMMAGDKSITLVDVPVTAVLPAHAGGATGVVFTPNNAVFTGGKDKTVKQSDLATGKETKTLATLPEPVNAIALSRDGTQLAIAAGKVAKVVNVADAKELASIAHPAEVIAVAFNADRTRLVTGTTDNLARIFDIAKNYEVQAFGHGAAVNAVAFSTTKPNLVITASADKTAVVNTITNLRYSSVSTKPIRSLVAAPSGAHLLAAGDDGIVRLINMGNGETERKFEGAAGAVNAVAVSRNGQIVAAAGTDKAIRVYAYNDAALIGQFPAAGPVRSLAFSPSGTSLLSSDDKSATMWNIAFQPGNPPPAEFGKPIQNFEHGSAVASAALSNDGNTLLSGADDKLARVWKVAADGPTKNLQHPNIVDCVAYNKDGTQLATGCHDGIVRIFDVAKGTPIKQINAHTTPPQPGAVYSVAWSPDGKQIASASYDRSIKIWDVAAGTLVKEIKGFDEKTAPKGHRDGVFSVAWSPDGKQIVSASSDWMIKLWNVDGSHVRDFVNPGLPSSPMQGPKSHPGWVYHLRWTPAGQIVSVGSAPRFHGYIGLWNPADGKMLYGADLPLGPFYHVALAAEGFVIACGPRMRGAPTADAVLLKIKN